MNWIACIMGLVAAALIALPMFGDRNLRTFFIGASRKDLKAIRHRFLLAAIAMVLLTQLLSLDAYNRQSLELQMKSRDLTGQVNLLNYLQDQLNQINTNRKKLAETTMNFANRLAADSVASPGLQKYVAENQADLQVLDSKFAYLTTWVAGWHSRMENSAASRSIEDGAPFQFAALQQKQELDKKMAAQCNYVFEFTIASLRACLTEQARQMGENVVSTYNGLPQSIQNNQVALGGFSLGDRPANYYYLSLKKGTSEEDPNCLCITCVKTSAQLPASALGVAASDEGRLLEGSGKVLYSLNIQPNPDKIISTFQANWEAPVSEAFPQSDYGRGVNAALSRLFAPKVVKNTYTQVGGWN